MLDIKHQNKNNESIQNYFQWLEEGADLPNEYIEIPCAYARSELNEHKIEIHLKPRSLEIEDAVSERTKKERVKKYLEIGLTNSREKICINIDNDIGSIYFYGWQDMHEYPIFNMHGNVKDVEQADIYGFTKIADNFSEFLDMLYCNG